MRSKNVEIEQAASAKASGLSPRTRQRRRVDFDQHDPSSEQSSQHTSSHPSSQQSLSQVAAARTRNMEGITRELDKSKFKRDEDYHERAVAKNVE